MPSTTPSEAEKLIELEGVSAASLEFPDRPIVQGVRWVIREGEWWVIGALPGGGKSGLLATAAGLIQPLAGSQKFWGRLVGGETGDALAHERRRVGLVFGEGGRMFRHLTVAENVALPYCYHRDCTSDEAAEEVSALLELMGLTFIAKVSAGRLNPSWRLRTALARALIMRPAVLFLDNPLLGLERRHKRWWLDFLEMIQAGQPFFYQRPITLVVAAYDVVPWLKDGRHFALLKQNLWSPLGIYNSKTGFDDPLWRDLLAEAAPAR